MDPGRADEAVTTEGAPHRHRAGRTRRWVELVAVQLHPATCPVCVTPSLALNSNLEQIAYMPGVVEAPIAPRETTAGRRGRMALEPPAHGDGEGYGSRPAEKKRVEIEGKGRAPAAGGRERDGGWRRGQPTGRNRGRQRCHVAGRGLLACARLGFPGERRRGGTNAGGNWRQGEGSKLLFAPPTCNKQSI